MNTSENALINEPDRVILYDALGSEAILDILWHTDGYAHRFFEEFELTKDLGSRVMGDPDEDFYQGVTFTQVIRRKADGRLFGYEYWEDISKHGEAFVEPNGDEHGLEFVPPADFDWVDGYFPQAYVFLPVEPFTITGYAVTKETI